jgi:hypothetical protein
LSIGSVEDFHLQDRAHAGRTKDGPAGRGVHVCPGLISRLDKD